MAYRPEILAYLSTPGSWAIAEFFAIALFLYCLADIIRNSDDKVKVFRALELLGFIIYAGIFENIGVLGNTYNYSLDRLIMVGTVPLSILMFEAVIFYAALRFAEAMKFPKWTIPFIVGLLAVLQDMTIDPVAVFDTHLVAGVMEGRWNWITNYKGLLFGIPFFNYTGWFFLMFYYTALIKLGRNFHKKKNYKTGPGIAYLILSPILGVLLIVSPITRFFLFLEPFFTKFIHRPVEISMLVFFMIISIVILIKYQKKDISINLKDDKVIWIIPLILHTFDIILAFSLKITIAYIPVLLFAGIHLGYLAYCYLKSHNQMKHNRTAEELNKATH